MLTCVCRNVSLLDLICLIISRESCRKHDMLRINEFLGKTRCARILVEVTQSDKCKEIQETQAFPETLLSGMMLRHLRQNMFLLENVGKTCAPEYAPESRRGEIVPGPEGEQHSQLALERCARMRQNIWGCF